MKVVTYIYLDFTASYTSLAVLASDLVGNFIDVDSLFNLKNTR